MMCRHCVELCKSGLHLAEHEPETLRNYIVRLFPGDLVAQRPTFTAHENIAKLPVSRP